MFPPSFWDFTAVSLACICANLVTHPAETLKTRSQTFAGVEPNLFRLASQIARNEGYVRPFYQGLSAGLWRAVISGGGRITIYNQIKIYLGDDVMAGAGAGFRSCLGMAAGGVAAVFAAPFDMVRTRQQTHKIRAGNSTPGLGHVMLTVLKTDGVRGLWAGFLRLLFFTYSLSAVTLCAATLCVYVAMKLSP
jgi:hypothetical protein